jgi:hypothetical protein
MSGHFTCKKVLQLLIFHFFIFFQVSRRPHFNLLFGRPLGAERVPKMKEFLLTFQFFIKSRFDLFHENVFQVPVVVPVTFLVLTEIKEKLHLHCLAVVIRRACGGGLNYKSCVVAVFLRYDP